MNRLRKTLFLVLLTLLCSTRLFASKNYEIQFSKGDISQKTTAVLAAAAEGDYSLAVKAIEFAISEKDILSGDTEYLTLVRTSVKTLSESNSLKIKNNEKNIIELFNSFTEEDIRLSVLDIMANCASANVVTVINNYLTECTMNNVQMNPVILKAITVLGKIGNTTSFQVLFAISLNQNWPLYERQIDAALAPLAEGCEKEIIRIMNIAPIEDKIEILNILSRIDLYSQNIAGEVAEIGLSVSISNIQSFNDMTEERINLQIAAIRLLSKTRWTRASQTVTEFFPYIKIEYEEKIINAKQFAEIIECMSEIASGKTAVVLSEYLDSLNRSLEENNVPETAVIMAVIKTLGRLGDKSAFDSLLSVTYLDYPEEISIAAKQALSDLKW